MLYGTFWRAMPTRTNLTIGRRSKSYPHCGSRGEFDGPPLVFVMLQYFGNILPLVESL